MSTQPKRYFTPAEYLALERASPYKSEFYAGEIFALAGASRRHNLITTNVLATLHAQLCHRQCTVYLSNMRVKVSETGLYTYPDALVVCGRELFDDREQDTLLNPTVIFEVLSKSTENYDRGKKFKNYRTLESLQEYLLISQDSCHVEHYLRQDDSQWLLSEADDRQSVIRLPSVDCVLALADVYDKVDLDLEDEDAGGMPDDMSA
jgi:Uma2 family endonuclease